jgi:hypothetical protein
LQAYRKLILITPAELWVRSALAPSDRESPGPDLPGPASSPSLPGLPCPRCLTLPHERWPPPARLARGRVRAVPAQCGPALFPLRRSQIPDLCCSWAAVRIALQVLARLPRQAKEPSCSEGPAAPCTRLHPPSLGVRVFQCAGVPRPLARIPSGNSFGPRSVATGPFPTHDRSSRGSSRRGAWVLLACSGSTGRPSGLRAGNR